MLAWINFTILVFASLLFMLYYVRSVSPATREQVIGPRAYARCGRDRIIASVFETITVVNYLVYVFNPLDTPLPNQFPWPWWISALLAVIIGAPSITLMVIGMRDAGEETLHPKKEHTLYGGIYTKIRHPQAAGEVFVWLALAFLLHSPFLAVFSLIYFPIFWLISFAEEQDLIWRYGAAYVAYRQRTGMFFPKRSTAK
jgi:protein-S-isoprenylcysteine O-methyltransferase Ste14